MDTEALREYFKQTAAERDMETDFIDEIPDVLLMDEWAAFHKSATEADLEAEEADEDEDDETDYIDI